MAEIRESYEQAIQQLNTRYLSGLKKLEGAYTARKMLDAALAVNREIRTLESGSRLTNLPSSSPPELSRARSSYAEHRKAISGKAQEEKTSLEATRKPATPEAGNSTGPTAPMVINTQIDEKAIAASEPSASTPPELVQINVSRNRGPDSDFFRDETWTSNRTIRAGSYRMRDTISVTNQISPTVTMEPGVLLKDGAMFFGQQGKINTDGCLFEDQTFMLEFSAVGTFNNTYFDECLHRKAGRFYAPSGFSARWNFNNCIFEKTFFREKWSAIMEGVVANYCTFNQIDFDEFTYFNDAYTESKSDKLALRNCRFVRCDIPISVLLFTENCVFERCKFIKHDLSKPLSERVEISIRVIDQINKIPEFEEKIKLTVIEGDNLNAGAKLKLIK